MGGDPSRLIDSIRAAHPDVKVQAADSQAVYGYDHAVGALCIAIESLERKVMMANKLETEVLLRLACTNQISDAMKKAALKAGQPGCFIAFSTDIRALKKFGQYLEEEFELDDSVLSPSRSKKVRLATILGFGRAKIDHSEFLDFLLERAAILVRG